MIYINEEWKTIKYQNIKKDMYEISTSIMIEPPKQIKSEDLLVLYEHEKDIDI